MTKAKTNRKTAAPVRTPKTSPAPPSKATVAKVEATARKAVDKAVAQDRKERAVTVETLTKGQRVVSGAKRGVVYAVTKSWAIIDWIDGEREGWNNKALKRGKARKG